MGGALIEAINHLDAENKKHCAGVYITKATEHTYQKDKQFILIQVNYRSNKLLLTPVYKKLVTELEKKLKKTVLVLSTRKIQSRWVKENKTQARPNSRTLTAVYNSFLDELLLPGVIIGSRTRVRLDGSSFTKIVLDKTEQHFLENNKPTYVNLQEALAETRQKCYQHIVVFEELSRANDRIFDYLSGLRESIHNQLQEDKEEIVKELDNLFEVYEEKLFSETVAKYR